jgi:hypothetical protein
LSSVSAKEVIFEEIRGKRGYCHYLHRQRKKLTT